MATKPPRYCGKCRAVHTGECPERKAWVKPVHKQSGRGGRPWQRKRKRIFERDSYQCQECLKVGRITFITLHGRDSGVCDHIIPKAEGGTDDDSNLQSICQRCDKVKTQAESMRGRGG